MKCQNRNRPSDQVVFKVGRPLRQWVDDIADWSIASLQVQDLSYRNKWHQKINKSSAVAKMDDHLAITDMGRKWGGLLCPFLGMGSWVPI